MKPATSKTERSPSNLRRKTIPCGSLEKLLRCCTPLLLATDLLAAAASGNHPTSLYVAPEGRDDNPGTSAKPFQTIERARDEIRKLKQDGPLLAGGMTVWLGGGIYERTNEFELKTEDSGTEAAPVQYRARPDKEVRFVGGKVITGFKPVTDLTVLNRLDPGARGQVQQADLRAQGVTDFGRPGGGWGAGGGPGLEVFFQDQPMTLARYPNDGFIKIAEVLGSTPVDVRGTKGCKEGKFVYDGDRPRRWVGEKDPWVLGYWFWDWSEQRQHIAAIDPEKHSLELSPPDHGYGYRKGQWFYGFNLLAELDQPGEWYLDRETGMLYFWPPAPLAKGQVLVSVLPTLVTMKEVSHVTIRGITLEAARGTAVTIEGGTRNQIVGCTLRNHGGWAVNISGGRTNGVTGCDIYATGDGGISLNGGDRQTLTAAGHYADNNHIHHWSRWHRMYQPAIAITGVGNRAAHNLLDNAPHTAILFSGNDHLIEFNEIHSVCFESNDAGAIYCGRNWTMRGTIIRNNYLHHIQGFQGRGCVGVYLDDMYCGTTIASNLFYQVTQAAFIGGGHDNTIANNIFVDCQPAIHVDSRGTGWDHAMPEDLLKEAREKGTLNGIHFNAPPYSTRYPQLVDILDHDPASPTGTLIARNVCWGGKWNDVEKSAKPFVKLEDNLIGQDPHFVDARQEDFQLRKDSPAYQLGFQRIPLEKIGLTNDDTRASWPVKHTVRPLAKPPTP